MKSIYWIRAGIAMMLLLMLGAGWMGVHQQIKLLERRVDLLQDALAPAAPRLVANNWAQAVKERNGAWQYALLSKSLQDKYLREFKKLNWVTGASSPWVDNYEVKRISEDANSQIQYEVKFNWYTAAGYFGSTLAKLWVAPREESAERTWFIRQIKYNDTEMEKNTIAING